MVDERLNGRSIEEMWKVGDIQDVRAPDGGTAYGFNVTNNQNQPLVSFAYTTRDEAVVAATQVRAAIENAVNVCPFGVA
jgi:hypothetical protein